MDRTLSAVEEKASYTRWQLTRYFLHLGTIGFGGPVALVGVILYPLVSS